MPKVSLARRRAAGLLLAPLLPSLVRAADDTFPSKPVRIVLPVGPGGADVLMRLIAEQLSPVWKQPVVIDNRPGADGLIAMQALLQAPADGHTLLLIGPQPMVFNPLLRSDLPYKVGDVQPVVGVARGWPALIVGPGSRFHSFDEMLAAVRKEPGSVTIGTNGLSYRVGATYLGRLMGGQFKHVSYKTFPQIFTDLSNGVLDAAFVDASPVVPLAAGGKLKVLAAASRERLGPLPQVPTLRERGIAFELAAWTALAVRSGTPDPIARKLETDLQAAIGSPPVRALVAKLGTLELTMAPGRTIASDMAADTARFRDVVREIAPELGVEK